MLSAAKGLSAIFVDRRSAAAPRPPRRIFTACLTVSEITHGGHGLMAAQILRSLGAAAVRPFAQRAPGNLPSGLPDSPFASDDSWRCGAGRLFEPMKKSGSWRAAWSAPVSRGFTKPEPSLPLALREMRMRL